MDPLFILLIGMVVVVGGILVLKLHPFLALVLAAIAVSISTPAQVLENYLLEKNANATPAQVKAFVERPVGKKIAEGLGKTAGQIGILIAMAAIIGKCLLESGAADKIVRSALKIVGEKRAPFAFIGSGFTLGIPVYFDTVFYLMIPLAKALATRTGKNFALYVLTIICGATISHSLIPPTPGPLLVAAALDISIGKMMIAGLIVGAITIVVGYAYASWANKKWPIPVRESADISVEDLKKMTEKDEAELPSLSISLLPILLPVFLIAGHTILKSLLSGVTNLSLIQLKLIAFFEFFGDPNIALTLSAFISIWTLVNRYKDDKKKMADCIQKAIASAGMIILITAAGGAFGSTLQETGIGNRIKDLAVSYNIAVLPLAFFVTFLIRTAQGSATVAMITAVGILGGLSSNGQLGFDPVYLALAIGCGSKPFPWMNDSGFWVICKMSNMTEKETLRTSSSMMSLMGLAGLIATMIGAKLFPMI